jgi:hypothetical protein
MAMQMLPTGAVIDRDTRETVWGEVTPSEADYAPRGRQSSAGDAVPLLPFLVFGLKYDLDVVLVSTHPEWEMHEIARIQTPDGRLWIAKDTRASTGDQMLVADLDQPNDWLPEVPLARRQRPIEVNRQRASDGQLELDIAYTNYDGMPVNITYSGPVPSTRTSLRNGSTMGHSRRQVMAVLDLPVRDFGTRASIRIGAEPYSIRRAAGLIPLRLGLKQTQGGIPDADVVQMADPRGGASMQTVHQMADGSTVRRSWRVSRNQQRVVVRQHSPMRTLEFEFLRAEVNRGRDRSESSGGEPEALELIQASVFPWHTRRVLEHGGMVQTGEPAFRVRFQPALPDLRYDFAEGVESRFVMDVGGQRNHAVGDVVVRSGEGNARLEIRGRAPRWVASRCIQSIVRRRGAMSQRAWRRAGLAEESSGPKPVAHLETDVRPCQ